MRLSFDIKVAIALVVVVLAVIGLAWMYLSAPIRGTDQDRAVYMCVFLCKAALNEGLDMDNGPCLSSGSAAWDLEDWVCDVAHWPRQDTDTLAHNQCPEYGSTASHFVEVNPDCVFIRVV